jgi:hypothetical protein
MSYLQQEIERKLDIYIKKYDQKYTKCLIRGIEIPISQRPEELVRQIFLHFLMYETKLFPDKINIKVEANHHDIEIYRKQQNPKFQPHQNPLIIVEVKREDVNLQNHYEQIQRYLKNARCDIGILYNYHQILVFRRQDNNWKIDYIKSLGNIEKMISSKANSFNNDLLGEFEKAQKGNFDSFLFLVKEYGQYTHKVIFKVRHQQSEVEGYFFDIQENKIYYKIRVCGKYSKKQSLGRQDFEKLISITY